MAEARAVRRLVKNLEDIKLQICVFNQATSISEVRAAQDLLTDQWKEFQGLEEKLKGKFDEANTESVEKIENLYFDLKRKLFKREREFDENKENPCNKTMDELVLNQTNFLHEISAINKREGEVRLPRVNIPTFSGVYSEFPSFRDLFETSIHDNINISKVHKLQYLKGLVKGEAFSLIKHLSVTEANYGEAWDKIKMRYNKPKHIIHSLLKQFMEQANMQSCCSKSLRQLADVSDEAIRGLRVLGEKAEDRDPWLIYILANKLDSESKEAWAHETAENVFPSLAEFFKFINKRSDALESLSSMSKSRSNPMRKVTAMIAQVPSSCPLCSGDHYLGRCEQYLNQAVTDRKRIVAEKRLCFNCLASTHQAKICKSKYNCAKCRRRHHVTLHSESEIEKEKKEDQVDTTSLGAMMQPITTHTRAILPTAIVTLEDKEGNHRRCRALLDSGSQSSFISEDCVQRLQLPRKKTSVSITGITTGTIQSRGRCAVVMGSLCDSRVQIPIDALVINQLPTKIPGYQINKGDIPLTENIQLADPGFNKVAPIDLLIGADKFFEILETEQRRIGSTMFQKTVFGWVVSGQFKSKQNANSLPVADHTKIMYTQPNCSTLTFNTQLDLDVEYTLRQFWEIEEKPRITQISPEETKCETFYTNTFKRREDGRYVVKLPFIDSEIKFGNSVTVATTRLLSLERKLAKDVSLRQQYIDQMREYVEMGHMVEIPPNELKVNAEKSFYLPHHSVIKKASETTKLRVVFDGSSKTTNGLSLNDSLMVGPTLQPKLWVVLMRFRCHRTAITADIERMYRQVVVSPEDTDYQRLLWRESSEERIRHYKLTRVTFGLACSAYLAIRTLQQLARDNGD